MSGRTSILAAAARRFFLLLGGISVGVVVVGLLVSAVGTASPNRAISLGFYGVGAFLLLGGFLLGNRGPYRPENRGGDRLGRGLRRATPDDMRESVNMTVLLSVLGFILLAVGVIIDSRFRLL